MNELKRLIWVLAGLATASLIYFVIWLFIPAKLNAKVATIEWSYTVNLRIREIKHDAEWGAPGNKGFYNEPAFNTYCRSKYYGTEDCNPHDCMCSTDKNGRTSCFTCYDQCAEYRDWCEYSYYEWPVARTQSVSGISHQTFWPELVVANELQRLQKIEEYTVVFKSEHAEVYEYNPSKLLDFCRFNIGEYWRLQVGKIRTHHIEDLKLLKAEKD